jgi:hypothetical protein
VWLDGWRSGYRDAGDHFPRPCPRRDSRIFNFDEVEP